APSSHSVGEPSMSEVNSVPESSDFPAEAQDELDTLREKNAELERRLSGKGGLFSVAKGSKGRRVISTVLVVLAAILTPISVITVWTANTVTNTDHYVATVGPLASNPDIQGAISNRV